VKNFYIYIYLDPRKKGRYFFKTDLGKLKLDYEPIYVGKGTNDRWKFHLNSKKCQNFHLKGKINEIKRAGYKRPIIKLKRNLEEKKAYCLEKNLIEKIGRLCIGTGPLVNFAEGGLILSSEDLKNLWKDPKYRKKQLKNRSELRKKDWENPEYKKQQSISRKKSWDNNPERKKILGKWASKTRKKDWKDPEIRRKRSQGISKGKKEKMKDPEYRKEVLKNLKKAREVRIEKCKNGTVKKWNHSEETKKKMSKLHLGENNYFFGKHYRGEKNSNSKLTEKKVLKIRKLEEKGWSFFDLSEMYKVSESCICRAVEGSSWTYI